MGHVLTARTLILLALLSVGSSCSSGPPFTPSKWAEKADMSYVNRSSLLPDLLQHYPLIGLSYPQLTALLGEPDFQGVGNTTGKIGYQVEEEYGFNIDPVHSKSLVFQLDQDSTVLRYEVVEHNP